jgi:hypothetical protein
MQDIHDQVSFPDQTCLAARFCIMNKKARMDHECMRMRACAGEDLD